MCQWWSLAERLLNNRVILESGDPHLASQPRLRVHWSPIIARGLLKTKVRTQAVWLNVIRILLLSLLLALCCRAARKGFIPEARSFAWPLVSESQKAKEETVFVLFKSNKLNCFHWPANWEMNLQTVCLLHLPPTIAPEMKHFSKPLTKNLWPQPGLISVPLCGVHWQAVNNNTHKHTNTKVVSVSYLYCVMFFIIFDFIWV